MLNTRYSLATTPHFTLAIIHNSIHNNIKQLGSVTLCNAIILDQSINQGPGWVKYDLEGLRHPQYSTRITALHLQFSEEDTSGFSLGIEPAFSTDLYAFVMPVAFTNHSLEGKAKLLFNLCIL